MWKKLSNQEKVSGNTVFWFFTVFPSVSNIPCMDRPKSTFCTCFWKFGTIHEYWDDKKWMLNGKYSRKVKNSLFFAKKCHFWILAKKPKTNTTLLLPKNPKLQNLKSDFQYLTKRTQKRLFLAIFRPKMADFDTGPIYTTLFLSDFWWGGTATGLLGVFSFWLFLVIFCQKMLFLAPIGKVLKIRLQILKIQIFWQ